MRRILIYLDWMVDHFRKDFRELQQVSPHWNQVLFVEREITKFYSKFSCSRIENHIVFSRIVESEIADNFIFIAIEKQIHKGDLISRNSFIHCYWRVLNGGLDASRFIDRVVDY